MSGVAVPVNTLSPDSPTDPVELRCQVQNWIACLQAAERMGAMNDEPEGKRYIQISDTLAQSLVIILESLKETIK